MGYDPSQAHKRLGDGFYEQRLVREQVLKLTGRPSINGGGVVEEDQELVNNGPRGAGGFHLGAGSGPDKLSAPTPSEVHLPYQPFR